MGEENIYEGSSKSFSPSYGLESNYGEPFFGNEYRAPSSSFALTTDARSANQLAELSKKLNTGTKTVEMSFMDTHTIDSIPKQHLEEINRLRKIAGNIDLTMHGPIVEASGMGERGVSEDLRQRAEKQIVNSLEKAHSINPEGNVVVTFHSTAQLPDLVTKSMEKENGVRTEKMKEMVIISERDGNVTMLKPKTNYLEDKGEVNTYKGLKDELNEFNKEKWNDALAHASFQAHQGKDNIMRALEIEGSDESKDIDLPKIMKELREYNTVEGRKKFENLGPYKERIERQMQGISHGEIYVKDAYGELQNLFNQAWESANQGKSEQDINELKKLKEEIVNARKSYLENPSNIQNFANSVLNGINVLNNISTPQLFRPMEDFVMEKSSETFSNAALQSYQKFKDNSPIISIENPPAGGGISRADELRKLIDESRKKLANKLVENEGLDEDSAKKQAEKLIGATWDVGHINMIKQFGYNDKDVLKETEKIAKYVNKIHLSDNFGMDHTELPMGMGNVPMKGHLEKLKDAHGDKVGKIKKVIEAIDWYKNFQTSPFTKTLQSFGSPVYGMQMAPYWNQTPGMNSPTYSGYGMMLPDQHFSMYGSGFSGMPQELGGQVAGRSRLSGNAME